MTRITLTLMMVATLGCGRDAARQGAAAAAGSAVSGVGDPAIGRQHIDRYACLACHRIPGFEGPQGSLGPSLAGMGSRPLIGGRVPNNPDTMTAFLQNPQAVDPNSRMTPVGVSEEDARHITAFLFTLK